MSWLRVSDSGLQAGDRLVGPFGGGMLTLLVVALAETGGDCYVELGGSRYHSRLFPRGLVDIEALPAGWRHVRARNGRRKTGAKRSPRSTPTT